MASFQNKTPLENRGETKRVTKTSEPPIIVPVVVVVVDVHLALVVIPLVERGELYKAPPVPPSFDPPSSKISELNRIRHL